VPQQSQNREQLAGTLDLGIRIIGTAIVHQNQLVLNAAQRRDDFLRQPVNVLCFIVDWNDD
jgi:hypothetical protein